MNAQDDPAPNVDILRCDRCDRPGIVRHRDLGEIRQAHELFREQERDGSDARLLGMGDHYDGPPLDQAGYEAAVEALARRCECGGAFRFVRTADAPPGPDEVGNHVGCADQPKNEKEQS